LGISRPLRFGWQNHTLNRLLVDPDLHFLADPAKIIVSEPLPQFGRKTTRTISDCVLVQTPILNRFKLFEFVSEMRNTEFEINDHRVIN
jgi:hypothetical protein